MAARLRKNPALSGSGSRPILPDGGGLPQNQGNPNTAAGRAGGAPRLTVPSLGLFARQRDTGRNGGAAQRNPRPPESLFLRPEINRQDVVEDRLEFLPKSLVVRVDQVGVTILLGLESEEEDVGEAFIVFLRTDVRAPLERMDFLNLLFQVFEGVHYLLDLFLRGRRFEFEGDNVVQFAFGIFARVGCGDRVD